MTNIINKIINRTHNFDTKFKYSVITRKIEIIIAHGERLYLKSELLKLLGFDTHIRDFDNRLNDGNLEEMILVANQPLNFNLTSRNIYVHSNIVRSMIIGNDHASILRIIPFDEKMRGDYITMNFINKYYLPLATHYIKNIIIELRNDRGNAINFQNGTVTTVLHFRKKFHI